MERDKRERINLEQVKKPEKNQNYCFVMVLLLANRFQSKLDVYIGEITLKQWLLLCMLNRIEMQDVSINDLAVVMGCSRQNVKKMVDILVKKEYLKLKESNIDKRAYQVLMTEKARKFFLDFGNQGNEIVQRLFKGISEEELAVMAKVMDQVSNNIEIM